MRKGKVKRLLAIVFSVTLLLTYSGMTALAETVEPEKGCYKFSIELAAKEASDTITAKVYDGEDNAVTLIGGSSGRDYTRTGAQYSLMQYFDWLEREGRDDNEKEVGAAASDYCAAAQIYFKYNADDLEVSSAVDAVTAETLSGYIAVREGELPAGVSIGGISAMLESDNTFRLYLGFKGAGKDDFHYFIDGEPDRPKASFLHLYTRFRLRS